MMEGIRLELDDQERLALGEFLRVLQEQAFDPSPTVDLSRIHRGPEGQLVIPAALDATEPSFSFGMLMAQKVEHLYRQTACRIQLTVRPLRDPKGLTYAWTDGVWRPLS